MPSIAILGASNDPNKFGNRALRIYRELGWTVYPVNPKQAVIDGLKSYPSITDVPEPVDRASLYLPPVIGIELLDAIAARGAKELWVNPGAGSPELVARAEELGLAVVDACSIVAASDD